MKMRISRAGFFVGLGAAFLVTMAVLAQTAVPDLASNSEAAAPETPATDSPAPVLLPAGVEEILRLTRAQVGDEVTVNYIQNSGTIYDLSPPDIIYLKEEGVSDPVIHAMQDQGRPLPAESTAQSTAMPPQDNLQFPPTPPAPDSAISSPAPAYAPPAPIYIQVPMAVAPEPTPASTVYVIPDRASGATSHFYPSGYVRNFAAPSSVVTIGSGYGGGHRCYSTGYHSGYARNVCVIGRR